ncbi:MAG: hypothetical protein UV67_C0013G0024 [Parcubacteria group bacterium GW2011_GWC1_43_12]|nr:MAG: hypothetical protein UV34_C0023G0010 [Parcubacteria group bacterium GW2011_GWB1_42_6]KKS91998.1 MAG: hypothetical protein UV67_C0013G0024 [Parcubacteria group bacterium GW2011_GWC1_43_12]
MTKITQKITNGMNKIIFSVVLVALAGMAVAVFSLAAETATVTGTVTVSNYAISITGGENSFAYGTMSNNSASSTMTLFSTTGITATNDGSKANFDIYSADTGDWTLDAATSTPDYYTHKFCNETDNDCATSGVYGADFTALDDVGNVATLAEDLTAISGTVDFQLSMHTPNPSTVYTQQSAVVTVQASAPTNP